MFAAVAEEFAKNFASRGEVGAAFAVAAEIVRRVDGRDVGTLFAQEFAGPLELDLWLGVPPEHHHRIAPVHYAPDWPDWAPPEGDKLIESLAIPQVGHDERLVHLQQRGLPVLTGPVFATPKHRRGGSPSTATSGQTTAGSWSKSSTSRSRPGS